MVLGVGLFASAGVLGHSLVRGRKAPANPWGAATLEWQTTSPPPLHNFKHVPTVSYPYDYTDLVYEGESSGYVRRPAMPLKRDVPEVKEPALV